MQSSCTALQATLQARPRCVLVSHDAYNLSLIGYQHKAPSSAVDELDNGINQAAAEGFHDVQSAKATGAGYVAQAKNLAGSALSTAQVCKITTRTLSLSDGNFQSYLPNTTAQSNQSTGAAGGGIMSTLQSTANAAIATAGGLLSSAQTTLQPQTDAAKAAAQPHVENARAAVQSGVENARAAAQPHVDSAITFLGGTPAATKPSPVAPTTAPLETGSHIGNGPYPAATNAQSAGITEVRK